MLVTFPLPKHQKHGRFWARGPRLSYDGSRSLPDSHDFTPFSCSGVSEELAKDRCHGKSNGEPDGAGSGVDPAHSCGREGAEFQADSSVGVTSLRVCLLDTRN